MKFQELNIETLLLESRAKPHEYLLAWLISIMALLAFFIAYMYSPKEVSSAFNFGIERNAIDYFSLTLQMLGGIFFLSIVQGLLFPFKKTTAQQIRRFTPFGYLEAKDNKAFQLAYNHILSISSKVNFSEALELAEFEPEISSNMNLQVIANQKKRNLAKWLHNKKHLEQACHFLYLCHLAEQKRALLSSIQPHQNDDKF